MSTPKENIIFSTKNVLYSKYFSVLYENLADAVKKAREEKSLSLEDVRKRSRNRLATSYISRIENGQISSDVISVGKLQALAKGVGLPEDLLFALARRIRRFDTTLGAQILMYVESMPRNRQDDVLNIAKMFYGQGGDQSVTPRRPADAPQEMTLIGKSDVDPDDKAAIRKKLDKHKKGKENA